MSVSYTTTELVARIRRATQMSEENLKLDNDEVLQIADEAIQSDLWPTLRSCIEEYAVAAFYQRVQTLEDEPYGSPAVFRLPPRASGSTILAVYQLQDGENANGTGARLIERIDIADLTRRIGDDATGYGATDGNQTILYAISGDFVHLYPRVSRTCFYKVLYERRPSRLVFPDECALVTDISVVPDEPTSVQLTATFPVEWVDGERDARDIVRASMQTTDPVADSGILSDIVPPDSFTYSVFLPPPGGLVAQMSVGDYVCPEGTTCVFPLPDIWWPIAITRGAADCLMQAGYAKESEALEPKIDRLMTKAVVHSSSRVRKQPKPIFDMASPLRRGWTWGTSWWGNNR